MTTKRMNPGSSKQLGNNTRLDRDSDGRYFVTGAGLVVCVASVNLDTWTGRVADAVRAELAKAER